LILPAVALDYFPTVTAPSAKRRASRFSGFSLTIQYNLFKGALSSAAT
jgi:hypothetical protein